MRTIVIIFTLFFLHHTALYCFAFPSLKSSASTSLESSGADSNPFSEGTQAVVLSDKERAELLEYVNDSKVTLEKAMEQAKGKSLIDANTIYLKAMQEVVLESYKSKPRSELLMRYILNQALELTYGIPSVSINAIEKDGVLLKSTNQDLLTIILEDSIQLALQYVEKDKQASSSGSFLELPYIQMASKRLQLARNWYVSILETHLARQFLRTILQQWLTAAAAAAQTHHAKHAEALTTIDQTIKEEPSIEDNGRAARILRKKLLWLLDQMEKDSVISKNDEEKIFDDVVVDSNPQELSNENTSITEVPINRKNDFYSTKVKLEVGGYQNSANSSGIAASFYARTKLRIGKDKRDDDSCGGYCPELPPLSANLKGNYNTNTKEFETTDIQVKELGMLIGFGSKNAGATLFPVSYVYHKDKLLGVTENGVRTQFGRFWGKGTVIVEGIPIDMGGQLEFINYVFGANSTQGYKNNASMHTTLNLFVGKDLGKIGYLKDEFQFDWIGMSIKREGKQDEELTYLKFSNNLELNQILNSPIGVSWTLSNRRTLSDTTFITTRKITENIFSIQGEF